MKKKILAIVLCIAMLAIAIVGGTMAYFTDTKAVQNTFTVGNVAITLTEAAVKLDNERTSDTYGDWLKDDSKPRAETGVDYGKLYPGQTIYKDPTIKNTGSEDAYVAAKVTVTSDGDIHSYKNDDGTYTYMLGVAQEYDNININVLASGGMVSEQSAEKTWNNLYPVYETATCTIYQEADREKNTYVFYVFVTEAMIEEQEVTLFTQLHIPEGWDNAEMAGFENFKINIEAFATQEYGFADCYTAITTVFPDEFDFT